VAVDLDTVVQDRVTAWEPMAGAKDIRLNRTGSVGVPVLAAPEALEQALDALIDNALKFGAPGGEVTVRTVLSDDGRAEIRVADDGPGLSDDERAHAVERFWRSPAHQNAPGSGLGLAIVHELISACGGDFTLLPAEPHGLDARIRIRLSDLGPGQVRETHEGAQDQPDLAAR
jgi:signal transduction histidine kinase